MLNLKSLSTIFLIVITSAITFSSCHIHKKLSSMPSTAYKTIPPNNAIVVGKIEKKLSNNNFLFKINKIKERGSSFYALNSIKQTITIKSRQDISSLNTNSIYTIEITALETLGDKYNFKLVRILSQNTKNKNQ